MKSTRVMDIPWIPRLFIAGPAHRHGLFHAAASIALLAQRVPLLDLVKSPWHPGALGLRKTMVNDCQWWSMIVNNG